MKNLLVAQSGGPTAAINATLAGVIAGAYTSGKVDKVLGAVNGIQGVFAENFIDLRRRSPAQSSSICWPRPRQQRWDPADLS